MAEPAPTETPSFLWLFDGTVDLEAEVVERDETTVALTTREADLLRYLAARPGLPVSLEELHRAVWGMSQKVVSRAAFHTASRLRRKLEIDPNAPRHLITVHGVGYRWEPGPVRLVVVPPHGPPSVRVPARVPDWPTPLFGRERELAAIGDLVRDGARLVTLVGPPGSGKTRLAMEVAVRGLPGVLSAVTVDFRGPAPVDRVAELVQGVAEALGIRLGSGDVEPNIDQVGRSLAARGSLLLVLDALEPLAAAAGPVLGTWLQLAPRVVILACTAVRLSHPAARPVGVGALDAEAAFALFEAHVERHLGEGIADPDREVVQAVVDRLDRLPLALGLAAAQCAVLSPRALLDRLAEPLDAQLEAGISRSWSLLPGWAQVALAQASVFRGGITVEGAEAVFVLPEGAPPVARALRELWERSLCTSRAGRDRRLTLYESIRAFAAVRLDESGGTAAAEARHLQWCLAVGEARRAEIDGPEMAAALAFLGAERENLRIAHTRALTLDPSAAARLALIHHAFERELGGRGGMVSLLDQTLAASDGVDPGLRGRLLLARCEANLTNRMGVSGAADADAALLCAEEAGDRWTAARVWMARGTMRLQAGELDGSEAAFAEGIRCAEAAGDGACAAYIRGARVWLQLRRGNPEAALADARAAVGDAERRGHLATLPHALRGEAAALRASGDRVAAVRLLRRAVADSEAAGRSTVTAVLGASLALACYELCDFEGMLAAGGQALELNRNQGDRPGVLRALEATGVALLHLGRFDEASVALEEAVQLGRTMEPMVESASAIGSLGYIRWAEGRPDEAERLLRESVSRFEGHRQASLAARQRAHLAALRACRGDLPEAEALLARAVAELAAARYPLREALRVVVEAHLAVARARLAGVSVPDLRPALDRTDPDLRFLADRLP